MGDALARLVKLQDMDNMIRDAAAGTEKTLGFAVGGLPVLQAAREKLCADIPRRWLGLYERLQARYGRAVVPVEDRICLGCFVTLPTGASAWFTDSPDPSGTRRASEDEPQLPQLCESCGRILYW